MSNNKFMQSLFGSKNSRSEYSTTNFKGRMVDIDRAKGLAILLVVFGHIVARQSPVDNLWYDYAKASVYSFHMAFFMFLSGVVFFARLQPVESVGQYIIFVAKRFGRLMPAYFLFAGVVFVGKLAAQQIGHVDNPVGGVRDLLNIVLFPMQSVSAFLWYIYVLFVVSIAAQGIFSLTKQKLMPLVILGACLLFVPHINFLALNQIAKYFLFFSLGALAVKNWAKYTSLVDRFWLPAGILFCVLLYAREYDNMLWLPISLISIPFLHGVCRLKISIGSGLLFLGAMTFPIYLMNTIAIGVTKAVMLKFFSWDGASFLFFFPILFLAGVLLPILIKRHVFSRYQWLNRITT